MRRFFIGVFILSLLATAGAYYWRVYLPEKTVAVAVPQQSPGARAYRRTAPDSSPEAFSPQSAPQVQTFKEPSERQDLAVTISLVSSVISALAALFQTWLTARSVRNRT